MSIKSLVEQIHKSSRYGVIYEMGAGIGISHNLMKYPGASNTLYKVHSLYSKEAFINHFGLLDMTKDVPRAVSKEYCNLALTSTSTEDLDEGVNFLLVSSFQLPEEPGSTKHGWIGYEDFQGYTRFYHLTFPPTTSRKEAIDEVALTGLNIINAGNRHCMFSSYIDRVETIDAVDLELTLEAFTSSPDRNKLSVFQDFSYPESTVTVKRIEDFLRAAQNILIYKGSFNPWHEGHQHTMDKSIELYNEAQISRMLCISVHTYGKGEMTTDELKSRLDSLSHLGYPIAVITKPFFSDLTDLILDKVNGTLFLTMGDDVMDKIVKMNDSYIFSNEKIAGVVVKRHNSGEKNYNQIPGVLYIDDAYPEAISSTQIRNHKKKQNHVEST